MTGSTQIKPCLATEGVGGPLFFVDCPRVISALPSKADIAERVKDVHFVPKADIIVTWQRKATFCHNVFVSGQDPRDSNSAGWDDAFAHRPLLRHRLSGRMYAWSGSDAGHCRTRAAPKTPAILAFVRASAFAPNYSPKRRKRRAFHRCDSVRSGCAAARSRVPV